MTPRYHIRTKEHNYINVRGDGRIRLVDEEYADVFKSFEDAAKCTFRMVDWCGYNADELEIVQVAA